MSDRESAYQAAARLAALAQPAALTARLVQDAGTFTGTAQAWARRALLAAYESSDQPALAEAVAAALVASQVGTRHEAEAYAARVRLAVRAENETAAVGAFTALRAGFPEERVTGEARALLAAAFIGEGGAGLRIGTPAVMAAAKARSVEGTLEIGAPVPNPTTGRVALSLFLPEASTVGAEVYDALGRRVAAVAATEHAPGAGTLALDASALAPGVYVARVMVGTAPPVVRRFVVAR